MMDSMVCGRGEEEEIEKAADERRPQHTLYTERERERDRQRANWISRERGGKTKTLTDSE